MAAQRWEPTNRQLDTVDNPNVSHAAAARTLKVHVETLKRIRHERGWVRGVGASPAQRYGAKPEPVGVSINRDEGSATVVTAPSSDPLSTTPDAIRALILENGLDPDEWTVVSATLNKWEALGAAVNGENPTKTLRQVKVSLRSLVDIIALLPAPAAWTGPKFDPKQRNKALKRTWQIVVTADDQAPYHNEPLHVATCMALRELQPVRVAHLGDLCDYTNISRHADHAKIKAGVDTCTQSGVDILVGEREAAPDAEFDILAGNHDIRPMAELLNRAERMADIHCAMLPGETFRKKVLDLRRLWRLDDLGINYVEDERGWQHGELDLVPGPRGLAAVHGDRTGKNVALNTLESVGRSVLMGHTHRPESVYQWNPTIGFEMRAMVIGAQCAVRGDKGFPTFATRDKWLQGGALVTVHGDDEWTAERMRWNGESLFVGGHRWTP